MNIVTEVGHQARAPGKSLFTPFQWDDPLRFDQQLTEDERAIRDAAHAYCQEKLAPRVLDGFRHERFDRAIMNEMGEMGFLGATLQGYGCAAVNYLSYGLIAREVRGKRTYRITKIPMRLDDTEVSHVITIGEDVTEWREAQEGIAQAEKLAARLRELSRKARQGQASPEELRELERLEE